MFTKISNQVYYGFKNENDNSIIKEFDYDERVLLILNYLYINNNLEDVSLFSIDEMVNKCGYIPTTGKGRTSDQFKSILLKLHEMQVIKLHSFNFNNKQLAYCEFTIDMNNNFFTLDCDVKDKILNYKLPDNEKIDNGKLLLLYCYFLCRIYKTPDDEDLIRDGGKAETCYPSYETISLDVGLVDKTITKYNQILVDLNLIRIANAGRYYRISDKKKHKDIHESPNTYTLYREDGLHKEHLKESIKNFKRNNDIVFIKKERCEKSVQSMHGFINKVKHLDKLGKAKAEDVTTMHEYMEKIDRMKYESVDSS